jgi:hypothetical protein
VRVATKGLLVAAGVVLLITGGRGPRGTSTAGDGNPRGVVSIVTVAPATTTDPTPGWAGCAPAASPVSSCPHPGPVRLR